LAIFWCFVLVLLDPAKSAEPPIKVLFSFVRELRTNSEDFLVAKLFISLIASCFSNFITFEKLFFKTLFIIFFFFL
jgi:hypothetical protein